MTEQVSVGPVVIGAVVGIAVLFLSIGAVVVVTVILLRYLHLTKRKSKELHYVA